MADACPISFELMNEKVARINGALTVLSMLVFLLTPVKWIIFVLAADLFIRGFLNPAFSVYSNASKGLIQVMKIHPVMTNAGPKIFAARVGFVFCGLVSLFYFSGLPAAGYTLGAVLVLFAFLEAAFGLCVACRLYPYMPDFVK